MACLKPCNTASCTATPVPCLPLHLRNAPTLFFGTSPRWPLWDLSFRETWCRSPSRFRAELIRRSRTSGTVLQTALCHIEAVRRKLPEIVGAPVAPVKEPSPEEPSWQGREATSAEPLVPLPLLCPRRTFLACLILASKFLQDRRHSNRALAKLSGLTLVRLAGAKKRSTMLWNGDFGLATHVYTVPLRVS